MASDFVIKKRRTVGLPDIPLVIFHPRRLFGRVEDVTAYGWTLLVLLASTGLVGYATVETGLVDRRVEEGVALRKAELERTQLDVVERSALNKLLEEEDKRGDFNRMVARGWVIACKPLATLASILLIAALLYGVVALTGRKPEWHTLMTICTFAGFVQLLGMILETALMVHYRTLDVDLSLGLLGRLMPASEQGSAAATLPRLLSGIEPFRIWYWIVVARGLSVTSQLRGWRAWLMSGFCFLIAACAEGAMSLGAAPTAGPSTASA